MDVVWLRHLAYVLMPALTVLWGESLRARFLHRGARRAIRLLLAALLAWQSVRLLKYMAEPAVLDADETLLRLLWYLYYIFRAALPVALLWIAHVADRDAVAQRLPVHLFALLVLNLALAIAILTNDWHEQFFSFPQEREGSDWEEEVEWGAYAYWTLWFLEVFTALAILWIKAKLQKIWRFQMVLPVVCCILFLLYIYLLQFSACRAHRRDTHDGGLLSAVARTLLADGAHAVESRSRGVLPRGIAWSHAVRCKGGCAPRLEGSTGAGGTA